MTPHERLTRLEDRLAALQAVGRDLGERARDATTLAGRQRQLREEILFESQQPAPPARLGDDRYDIRARLREADAELTRREAEATRLRAEQGTANARASQLGRLVGACRRYLETSEPKRTGTEA